MEVGIHANITDSDTERIGCALRPLFRELGQRLSGEYGGLMEHLWIDFELIQHHAKEDGTARYPFRFQKKVSGRSHFGLPPTPDKFNVGHFSVRPDFSLIATLPDEQAIRYALSLIYAALAMLHEKQKKLGGFDATLFLERFRSGCSSLGYLIEA